MSSISKYAGRYTSNNSISDELFGIIAEAKGHPAFHHLRIDGNITRQDDGRDNYTFHLSGYCIIEDGQGNVIHTSKFIYDTLAVENLIEEIAALLHDPYLIMHAAIVPKFVLVLESCPGLDMRLELSVPGYTIHDLPKILSGEWIKCTPLGNRFTLFLQPTDSAPVTSQHLNVRKEDFSEYIADPSMPTAQSSGSVSEPGGLDIAGILNSVSQHVDHAAEVAPETEANVFTTMAAAAEHAHKVAGINMDKGRSTLEQMMATASMPDLEDVPSPSPIVTADVSDLLAGDEAQQTVSEFFDDVALQKTPPAPTE